MTNLKELAKNTLTRYKNNKKVAWSCFVRSEKQIQGYKRCKEVEYKEDNKRDIKDYRQLQKKAIKLLLEFNILIILWKIAFFIGIIMERLEGKEE